MLGKVLLLLTSFDPLSFGGFFRGFLMAKVSGVLQMMIWGIMITDDNFASYAGCNSRS